MKYLFIVLAIFFNSFLCSAQYHRSAQDSFVRYIDKFLRMDPDFNLEFQQNLDWEDFGESISFYLELDGDEWDIKDEYPELFTSYGDRLGEHLASEIVNLKAKRKYKKYFVKVECMYIGDTNAFWIIDVDVYFN